MRADVEKLIEKALAEYDAATEPFRKGGRRGELPQSVMFLGAAISGLKGVHDNLKHAEEAKSREAKDSARETRAVATETVALPAKK
jgi:hypothetical protein